MKLIAWRHRTVGRTVGLTVGRVVVLIVLWIGVVLAGATAGTPATHAAPQPGATAIAGRPSSSMSRCAEDRAFQAVGKTKTSVAANVIGVETVKTSSAPRPTWWTCAVQRASLGAAEGCGEETSARGPPR